ncbi:MAG: hypothetical protein V1676_01065 [Candidatus Diapherotrites archaeon]
MGAAERFMQIYADLPLNVRKEIVLVVDDEPITWNVAYREIRGGTALGAKILNKLEALKIIGGGNGNK